MKPIIDSHCHVDMVLDRGIDQPTIDASMQEQNVTSVIQIAADQKALGFAYHFAQAKHPYEVFYTIGQHPGEAHEVDTNFCLQEADRVKDDKKFVAIGEIGLDYFYGAEYKAQQIDVFEKYLAKAVALNKPVCIHTRDAHEDTFARLKKVTDKVSVLIHCFTGNLEQMVDYLSIGCYISFSGIVTFKNATDLQEAACECPPEKMLVETDAPYLTPTPFRGRPNHPAMVRHTLNFLADLRGDKADDLAEQTYKNTVEFYRLPL